MTQSERALRLIAKAIKVNETGKCCVDITYIGTTSDIEFEIYANPSTFTDEETIIETFSLEHPDSETDDMIEEALDIILETGEMPQKEDND